MSSREFADAAIADLRRIQAAAHAVSGAAGGAQQPLSPSAVAAALAEAVKNDDSTTQAIAIRLSNLAQKYPDRAA